MKILTGLLCDAYLTKCYWGVVRNKIYRYTPKWQPWRLKASLRLKYLGQQHHLTQSGRRCIVGNPCQCWLFERPISVIDFFKVFHSWFLLEPLKPLWLLGSPYDCMLPLPPPLSLPGLLVSACTQEGSGERSSKQELHRLLERQKLH